MDFFEHQARAHRRTRWLLVYFVLAVLGIIGTLHLLAAWAFGLAFTDVHLLGLVSGGVLVVVATGSIYRMAELAQGGRVVAEMLGGRQLAPHPADLREQQLRNVVEEMALASGVPVPDIYVLDREAAINAFAAGNTPGDAVVAVTRGTLERLSRDELQGVVAHEFSHILNGDMRLNLRLIGGLNGILLLAILGRILFELGARAGGAARSSRDGSKATVPLFAIGAALWLVGSIGVFFAKLIKAAVSRQREFLADASAVQFTRNPDGIAGALWKIGRGGSRLQSPRADEASHLFFGNGLGESFAGLFATHPPIKDRIAAVHPGFQADAPPLPDEPPAVEPSFEGVPAFARTGARETPHAVPLIYAVLLSEDGLTRDAQLAALKVDAAERAEITRDLARRGEIGDALAVMDLALPALRALSPPQYQTFRENVRRLVEMDGEVDLFEFVLHRALVRHVDHFFTRSRGPAVRYRSLAPLQPDLEIVLSALAPTADAFAAAARALTAAGVAPLVRRDAPPLVEVGPALDRLAESDPATKRQIHQACVAASGDSPRARALLRAVADVLGCPSVAVEGQLAEALGLTPA